MPLFVVHHQHEAARCPAQDAYMGAMLLNHLSRPTVDLFEREEDGRVVKEPVSLQRVRALLTEPEPEAHIERGPLAIRGVAWSGAAPIARAEVSVGDGPWQEARLVGDRRRHSWQWWELLTRVEQPGRVRLRARATDLARRSHPTVRNGTA